MKRGNIKDQVKFRIFGKKRKKKKKKQIEREKRLMRGNQYKEIKSDNIFKYFKSGIKHFSKSNIGFYNEKKPVVCQGRDC